jgi:hypothetical protein
MPALEIGSKQPRLHQAAAKDVWAFDEPVSCWAESPATVLNGTVLWSAGDCRRTSPVTAFTVDARVGCTCMSMRDGARWSSHLEQLVGPELVMSGPMWPRNEGKETWWGRNVESPACVAIEPVGKMRIFRAGERAVSNLLDARFSEIAGMLEKLARWKAQDDISVHFQFRDAPAVDAFLTGHPRVAAALSELARVLRHVLPSVEAPILRVITDPLDLESQWLQVRLPLAMQPEEALAKIEEVDDAWWMNLAPEISRLVTVDVEYQ